MTATLRYDGQVVVVTGGARGIGRACVDQLAEREARVLIVDTGATPTGRPDAPSLAHDVAQQLRDAGHDVAACTDDASSQAGARSVIATAIDRWGRVDAVIANAGQSWSADLLSITPDDVAHLYATNAAAPLWLAQAAWPQMVRQGSGRIVTVASAGLFGYPERAHYAMSKGAVVGLTRSLAIEGRRVGIVANCVMPWAYTRLATSGDPDGWMGANIPPAGAAAVMAWLAHLDCDVSGEIFAAAGRHVARVAFAVGPGVVVGDTTPEAVAAEIDRARVLEPVVAPSSTRRYVEDIVRPALADDTVRPALADD